MSMTDEEWHEELNAGGAAAKVLEDHIRARAEGHPPTSPEIVESRTQYGVRRVYTADAVLGMGQVELTPEGHQVVVTWWDLDESEGSTLANIRHAVDWENRFAGTAPLPHQISATISARSVYFGPATTVEATQ